VDQLADGRDVHESEEHGAVFLAGSRQIWPDHIVDLDHRGLKRVTHQMLGFKSFQMAQCTRARVELMHMFKKRQRVVEAGDEGLMRPKSPMRWPPKLLPNRGDLFHIGDTRKFATEPKEDPAYRSTPGLGGQLRP